MYGYPFIIVFILILVVFIWGGFYVYRGTKNKSTRWGFNINPMKSLLFKPTRILPDVKCPSCGSPLGKIRAPKSLKQLLDEAATRRKKNVIHV